MTQSNIILIIYEKKNGLNGCGMLFKKIETRTRFLFVSFIASMLVVASIQVDGTTQGLRPGHFHESNDGADST